MSDESPSTANSAGQPTERPLAPPPVTPAPVPVGDSNRLGMIIGAVGAVVALLIGVVVVTGGGDDDEPASGGTQPVGTDGPTTSDNGGASNNGGDPNDPCSSVRLSTDLAADNLEAVTGTCDGTWSVAARNGEALFVANFADGTWRPVVEVGSTALCHDDAVGFQWPAAVVDAVAWPCTTFTAPQLGSFVTESPDGEPLEVAMSGERVAGLQNALSLKGLLAPTEVDGMFGGATRQALLGFQAFGGLQLSARADLATLHALGLLADERVSLAPLVTNGIALGELLIGGNGRRVNEYLTGILGPPDRVSVRSTRLANDGCHDPDATYYTWSGLTVQIAGFDPTTFADTDWKMVYWRYQLTPTALDISSPAGGRVGDTIDQWRSKYSKIQIDRMSNRYDVLSVDNGLTGVTDEAGTVVLLYSGSQNCPGPA